jgi:hypothetical protein
MGTVGEMILVLFIALVVWLALSAGMQRPEFQQFLVKYFREICAVPPPAPSESLKGWDVTQPLAGAAAVAGPGYPRA